MGIRHRGLQIIGGGFRVKKILFLAMACLFVFSGAVMAAPTEEKGPVVGDPLLLDASSKTGMLIHLDDFFAEHPLKKGEPARGDEVFQSPRVQVNLVTNKGPLIGLHYHATADEIVYIHKGQGEMYIGGKWVPVKAGDLHVNPRGIVHATRVTGSEPMEVISFFAQPQANGNDKVFVPASFEGNVAGAPTLLDASTKEGLLINLPEFYAQHPRLENSAARGDSVYKSPRAEIVMVQNHGPLIGRHYHKSCEEIVLVYKGQGEMYIDGQWVPVKAGDLHINPRGDWHSTQVRGTADLQVFSLFTQPQENGNDKVFLDK